MFFLSFYRGEGGGGVGGIEIRTRVAVWGHACLVKCPKQLTGVLAFVHKFFEYGFRGAHFGFKLIQVWAYSP